jgi:hypothetical protein
MHKCNVYSFAMLETKCRVGTLLSIFLRHIACSCPVSSMKLFRFVNEFSGTLKALVDRKCCQNAARW